MTEPCVIVDEMARRESNPEDRMLAARIRKQLEKKGWRIEHLAVHTGLPFSTLATYLGDNPASIKATRLAQIAKALECSADELLGIADGADETPKGGKKLPAAS